MIRVVPDRDLSWNESNSNPYSSLSQESILSRLISCLLVSFKVG